MNRRTGAPRPNSPPSGHAFTQGTGPVANAQARLITAYWHPNPDELPSVEPYGTLRSDYEQAMTHATHADKEYQWDLRSLLQTFPQAEGEVPARPTPEQMQILFKKVLYHDQARIRGKGSKGGVKHYECKWPDCPFKGHLQKCMDHFFCEHVKLKFFKCEQPNCGIMFLRKYDLEKHKKKQHLLPRPSEKRVVIQHQPYPTPEPSRQTRSRAHTQHQPYSTQGRSTRRRPTIESIQGDRGVAGPSRQPHSKDVIQHQTYSTQGGPSRHTRSRAPIQHQPSSTQGRSTQRRPAIERSQGDRDPRTVSITGTTGLTQTKLSGPLGQFQVCLVKPLAHFLTMCYLHAHCILQFSRTVHVFHMQSVYIARQAIHLVIILNDLVDVKEGPDDEQYQERIDLEDELIELFDAMQEWGAKPDEGIQVDYDQGLLKINQQYAQFFRERFYFRNARNSADDSIYRKLVAYDRRTIEFRKWQYSRPDPTSMDVEPNRSNSLQPTTNPRSIPASQQGAWEVTGFEEGAEMRVDSESGVTATDVTP